MVFCPQLPSWSSSDFSKSYLCTFFIKLFTPEIPTEQMLLKYQRVLNEKKYLRDSSIFIPLKRLRPVVMHVCHNRLTVVCISFSPTRNNKFAGRLDFYIFLLAQTNIYTSRSFFFYWNKIILYPLHCKCVFGLMIRSGHTSKLVRSQYV